MSWNYDPYYINASSPKVFSKGSPLRDKELTMYECWFGFKLSMNRSISRYLTLLISQSFGALKFNNVSLFDL